VPRDDPSGTADKFNMTLPFRPPTPPPAAAWIVFEASSSQDFRSTGASTAILARPFDSDAVPLVAMLRP